MMKESRIKHLETNLFLSLERVHNGMSELKIEKEKEFIREILNSNGCETQLKHVKEVFTNLRMGIFPKLLFLPTQMGNMVGFWASSNINMFKVLNFV